MTSTTYPILNLRQGVRTFNARQTKVCEHDVEIIRSILFEQVLRLEVPEAFIMLGKLLMMMMKKVMMTRLMHRHGSETAYLCATFMSCR